jgi:two-component system OmpR family response regulator
MTQHTPSSQSPAESWRDKRIFTTGEAAAVCKVSQQTIIRCFDSGRLTGFRVPGSKFRRIPRDELIRFMKANNIPTDPLEHDRKRVLVVDDDERILAFFMDLFRSDGRFDARTASTGYDAGLLTERFRPDLIILDYMLPDVNGNIVCDRVRRGEGFENTKILIVSGVVNQDDVRQLLESGADGFLKKPFDLTELMGRVCNLLGMEAGA